MRTKSPMTGQEKIYQMITDQILKRLDAGEIPWRKPWKAIPGADGGAMPLNLISKKYYRGINILLLGMQGFESPYWLTFKQARQCGGSVRKGEHGTTIVFWKWFDKKEKDQNTGEETIGRYAMLRYYTVFNSEQCDDLKSKAIEALQNQPEQEEEEPDAIEVCEKVWKDYSRKPKLYHRGNSAFYKPAKDIIQLPKKAQFGSMEEYYSTLFHEAVHSTGHQDRLDRDGVARVNCLDKEKYSKEELIAEFGAAFLCGLTGISPAVVDNQAAYIKNWSKKLKEDRTLVIKAAGMAQKACDWITDVDTHFQQ